jgi:hypothetical protein
MSAKIRFIQEVEAMSDARYLVCIGGDVSSVGRLESESGRGDSREGPQTRGRQSWSTQPREEQSTHNYSPR